LARSSLSSRESTVDVLTSTIGLAAMTVTCSSIAPAWRDGLTSRVLPAPRMRLSWIQVLKPARETVMTILPGGTFRKMKVPLAEVTVALLPMIETPEISTLTPGSSSPFSSVTLPVIFPSMTDWAIRTAPLRKASPNTRTKAIRCFFIFFVASPLFPKVS
jgi:hypothetical protein